MRLAALYDIHGNLPALEAVLEEIRRLNVTRILVGGDVILGPMSLECLDLLLDVQLPVSFILGNCEIALLDHIAGRSIASLPEKVQEDIRWTADSLNEKHLDAISKWPKTRQLKVDKLGQVFFCHATPLSATKIFTRLTPEDRLLAEFSQVQASLAICGHTHMQFARMIGKVRVVNAGSVGMPFGKPGAYWLLLWPAIELRHTKYDLEKAAERIRQTDYPQAADFANNNVLQPPSEQSMLEIFAQDA